MCECFKLPYGFELKNLNTPSEITDGDHCPIPCLCSDINATEKGGISACICCGICNVQGKETDTSDYKHVDICFGLISSTTIIKNISKLYFGILCCCTGPICIWDDDKMDSCGWSCCGLGAVCNKNYHYFNFCCCGIDNK